MRVDGVEDASVEDAVLDPKGSPRWIQSGTRPSLRKKVRKGWVFCTL